VDGRTQYTGRATPVETVLTTTLHVIAAAWMNGEWLIVTGVSYLAWGERTFQISPISVPEFAQLPMLGKKPHSTSE